MNDPNSEALSAHDPLALALATDVSEARGRIRVKISRTVNSPALRHQQHVHAMLATLAGVAGVIGAGLFAYFVKPIWWGDLVLFACFFILIGFGVTVGFHRHFTHRSFQASEPVRWVLAALGCAAGQGPLTFWVSLHRLHHEFADRAGDPHSPNLSGTNLRQRFAGFAHAYIGWTVAHEVPNANFYARDILRDRTLIWINRHYYTWVVLGLVLPSVIMAVATRSWVAALEGLLWGGLVRMFAFHNAIWWITSFAHVWGRRDFPSKDLSTNNGWIAVYTLGESWHNNHHAFPSAATLDFSWWQLDLSGAAIRGLKALGLAWDVHRPSPVVLEARRHASPEQ